MGIVTLFIMILYIVHIEATLTSIMPDSFDDSQDSSPLDYNQPLIIILLPNAKHQNKKLMGYGLRQANDTEVIKFFPFCGEACIDLEGKCDINRSHCKNDPTICDECDDSKRRCIEKCLNIVNYH